MTFFTETFRESLLNKLIAKAKSDERISSCAIVGSYSIDRQDKWSDIDLAFGVNEEYNILEVLEDWTNSFTAENNCTNLFEIVRGNTIYRVFLLDNCLQVDLSFSKQNEFGAVAKTFKLVFGTAKDKTQNQKPDVKELFGYFVHHILRARICVERDKKWQAYFWINEARNYAFKLYCYENNLNPDYGREFDFINSEVLRAFENTIPMNLNSNTLLHCIEKLIDHIEIVSSDVGKMKTMVEKQLRIIIQ